MSRQSFEVWQGFTACMEQVGIPQSGNVPRGGLLPGDMISHRRTGWCPGLGMESGDRSGSVRSSAAHGG